MPEASTKPYLIRAIHEWCVDNGYTPYLSVSVNRHTVVPPEHVRAGEIVLNVSPIATNKLELGNDWVQFQARFSGRIEDLVVPVTQILAIYAKENGQGMAFDVPKPSAELEDEAAFPDTPQGKVGLRAVEPPSVDSSASVSAKTDGAPEKKPKKPSGKAKNHLTRIK